MLVGIKHVDKFLSTPSARRATGTAQCTQAGRSISIHALREEGDLYSASCSFSRRVFLSTPSARRATCPSAVSLQLLPYFYPRPPRGGRPAAATRPARDTSISIHALREEGDHAAHKL